MMLLQCHNSTTIRAKTYKSLVKIAIWPVMQLKSYLQSGNDSTENQHFLSLFIANLITIYIVLRGVASGSVEIVTLLNSCKQRASSCKQSEISFTNLLH